MAGQAEVRSQAEVHNHVEGVAGPDSQVERDSRARWAVETQQVLRNRGSIPTARGWGCHIVDKTSVPYRLLFTAQNYNFPVKYQTTWHIIYAQCAVAGLMLCHWLGDLLAVGGMPNESTMKWCPVIKLGMVRRNESTTCWCLFRN